MDTSFSRWSAESPHSSSSGFSAPKYAGLTHQYTLSISRLTHVSAGLFTLDVRFPSCPIKEVDIPARHACCCCVAKGSASRINQERGNAAHFCHARWRFAEKRALYAVQDRVKQFSQARSGYAVRTIHAAHAYSCGAEPSCTFLVDGFSCASAADGTSTYFDAWWRERPV